MLTSLAIGDAYGAGFEYAPEDFVRQFNTLDRYIQNPSHLDLKPGRYTDDTQMSIAVAEALLSCNAWTVENLADKFVEIYKRDPRPGYSRGFQAVLNTVNNGKELLGRIERKSDKSGGAMRAIPVGVLPEVDDVIKAAQLQASVTHATRDGMDAAAAVALMAHYCVYNLGPVDKIGRYVFDHVPSHPWHEPWEGIVGAKGWMSVRAAITAVSRNTGLSALLKDCVAFSGDVDTVAAIALGAAADHSSYTYDLPSVLTYGLETGRPFGGLFLSALDLKLRKFAVEKENKWTRPR